MIKPALESVLHSPKLPSLPAVAIRVIELTSDPSVPLTQLADVIENDQALATKILRTVNSSYYGLRKRCTNIRQAINFLGLNAVKSLALSFSLVESIDDPDDVTFDFVDYWRRGVYSAVAARLIAQSANLTCPDEAFFGALMQDVGMVALYRALGDTYLQIIDMAEGDHRPLHVIEQRTLGFAHPQVGYEIGKRWKIPPLLLAAIQHHHDADAATEPFRSLVRTVELAGHAAAALTLSKPNGALAKFRRLADEWFGLSSTESGDLLAAIGEKAGEMSSLLRVSTGTAPNVQSILERADALLEQHHSQIEAKTRAAGLTPDDILLTDPITDLGNRQCFNVRLMEAWMEVEANPTPLTVIICEVSAAGVSAPGAHSDAVIRAAHDELLARVGERLAEAAGDGVLVCRHGERSFGLVAENMNGPVGAKLMEKIRAEVEQPIQLDAERRVTPALRAGVAWHDPRRPEEIASMRDLLAAAETALQMAKASSASTHLHVPGPRAHAA
jgi:HD-like signal output (HDOD) protein/GGDEF domain-containing protein